MDTPLQARNPVGIVPARPGGFAVPGTGSDENRVAQNEKYFYLNEKHMLH